ncbi:hypothetical protein EDB83DRAFT_2527342 [Lactarius deliciosus]|nr:hypothetical protein EDB83DRAFT_2527342 [Lactarius deliciosus]
MPPSRSSATFAVTSCSIASVMNQWSMTTILSSFGLIPPTLCFDRIDWNRVFFKVRFTRTSSTTALGGPTLVHPANWTRRTSPASPVAYSSSQPLAPTAGPTFYIAIIEIQTDGGGSLALVLGIARFFISIVTTLLFSIMLR